MNKIEKPRTLWLADQAYEYIVDNLMPEEMMISLPVPLRRNSRLVAAFFGAITIPLEDRTNCEVYRPHVRIFVDWEECSVLGHEIASDIIPIKEDKPVGLLYSPEFTLTPTKDISEETEDPELELYYLLELVGPLYDRRDLTPGEKELVTKYNQAYRRIIHPDIWNFYEELNPDFFRWMEEQKVEANELTCPSCGVTNRPNNKFCTKCGISIGGSSP